MEVVENRRATAVWRLQQIKAHHQPRTVVLVFEDEHGQVVSFVASSDSADEIELWNTDPPLRMNEDYGDTRRVFSAASAFLTAREGWDS